MDDPLGMCEKKEKGVVRENTLEKLTTTDIFVCLETLIKNHMVNIVEFAYRHA